MDDIKRLFLAILLSVCVLAGWHAFFEMPKQERIITQAKEYSKNLDQDELAPAIMTDSFITVDDALLSENRATLKNDKIISSINLVGAKIDYIKLNDYKLNTDNDSPGVVLFAPKSTSDSYFVEFGWLYSNQKNTITLPDQNTLWKAKQQDQNKLTLTWESPENVLFGINITLDDNFMFITEQFVTNTTSNDIVIVPYSRIQRIKGTNTQPLDTSYKLITISHEGAIGYINNALFKLDFRSLIKNSHSTLGTNNGSNYTWSGFSDKYWATSLIPDDKESTLNIRHIRKNKYDYIQIDFTGNNKVVPKGTTFNVGTKLFAGAKELNLLSDYSEKYNIHLFDRNVDFGSVIFFITKPLFLMLQFLNSLTKNFGISILLLTFIIKLAMFPLTKRSYASTAKLTKLKPEMEAIQKRYPNDKAMVNQEILALFQKNSVNPMSGCLPVILQIPVFFALYKVLFISIEMRHAPFFWWIHDLSASDSSNVATLFGLINWNPPEILCIGILPILCGLTIKWQQNVSSTSLTSQDQTQAALMKIFPYILIVVFSSLPAGLVLYFTFSNIISILQQLYITKYIKMDN